MYREVIKRGRVLKKKQVENNELFILKNYSLIKYFFKFREARKKARESERGDREKEREREREREEREM